MRHRYKWRAARSLIQVRFFHSRIPLFLSWPITHRCNYRCVYCDRPSQAGEELPTDRALQLVDEFASLGTQFVFLSGGEPLVRKDVGQIVARCRHNSLFVCLTTNAALYLQRKREIGRVDMLKISLDGPAEAHDPWRAAGSHAEVIDVLDDARRDRIPVLLNPVVSKTTLPHLEYVVSIAERYGARIKFQPINQSVAGGKDIGALMLGPEEMRMLSSRLLDLRRLSATVANSRAGLRYMATLPAGSRIPCYAGCLFAYLMPDGDLYPCNRRGEMAVPESCAQHPAATALRRLRRIGCETCWCTSDAELNLMMRIDPIEAVSSVGRAWRVLRS